MTEQQPIWSDEHLRILTQYWAEGCSARKIGDAIGKTKSAVIGKAHRLELNHGCVKPETTGQPFVAVRRSAPKLADRTDNVCAIQGCRGPRQPGHVLCNKCLPVPKRTRAPVMDELRHGQ